MSLNSNCCSSLIITYSNRDCLVALTFKQRCQWPPMTRLFFRLTDRVEPFGPDMDRNYQFFSGEQSVTSDSQEYIDLDITVTFRLCRKQPLTHRSEFVSEYFDCNLFFHQWYIGCKLLYSSLSHWSSMLNIFSLVKSDLHYFPIAFKEFESPYLPSFERPVIII